MLTTCDKCSELRTHSTQDGWETSPGVIEWRGMKNGCATHQAVAMVHYLNGDVRPWRQEQ